MVFEQHMTWAYFYIKIAKLPRGTCENTHWSFLNNNGVWYLCQLNYRYFFLIISPILLISSVFFYNEMDAADFSSTRNDSDIKIQKQYQTTE